MANGDLMLSIESTAIYTPTSNTTDLGKSTLKFKDAYFAGIGSFGVITASASILTSVTASSSGMFSNLLSGASILSSVTTTSSGVFSNVLAGASIVSSLTATNYLAGGLSATYVGIASNNIASGGTAVILSASTAGSISAGYLSFVFLSGTSAFVPFFLSTSS